MDWLLLSFSLASAVGAAVALYIANNPSFWTLASRNPDFALGLLKMEACLIDQAPGSYDERYAGPFRIRTTDRVLHTVYMPKNRLDVIETKLSAILKTTKRLNSLEIHSRARGRSAQVRSRSL